MAEWVGALAVLGLGDQRVVAQIEGGPPALRLDVSAFFCDASQGSCAIDLMLTAPVAVVPAWQWTEQFPFKPGNARAAELIIDALGRSIRLGIARAMLPEGMQAPPTPAVVRSEPVVVGAVIGPTARAARLPDVGQGSATPATPVMAPMSLRGPPIEDDCYEGGRGSSAVVENLEARLESNPHGAWKALRDHGGLGARAISDWLMRGAPGASPSHVYDAAMWVLQCGQGNDWYGAMHVLTWEAHTGDILRAVRGRAPLFSIEQANWFVHNTARAELTEAAVALVGGHKQSHVGWNPIVGVTVRPSEVSEVMGSQTPEHHVVAVERMLDTYGYDEGLWRAVVKSIGIYYSFEVPGQETWGRVLVKVLREAPKDWEKLLQDAALQMARGMPPGIDEAVDLVIESGIVDVHTIMVAGFEDRIQRSGVSEELRGPLTRFVGGGRGPAAFEAGLLLRRLERELGR